MVFMEFSHSSSSTAADRAYEKIRHKVFSGDLVAGQRVSQRRLAKELGMSTVPVLEAMRRLESDGLVVSLPHCIARIRELSLAELEGLYLVREGLESVAARLAAQRIGRGELEHLRELSNRFDQALAMTDRREMSHADVELHRQIAVAARCSLLEQELDRLMLIERTAGDTTARKGAVTTSSYTSHKALVQTLTDHDADAAEYFMKKHIQAGYRDLIQDIGEQS